MASILETNFTFTYPGILTNEVFFKPTVDTPALSDIFTIDQGINFQKRYNVLPSQSNVLQPYTGCGQTYSNTASDITDVLLQVKEFSVRKSWCKDDFTNILTGAYNHLAQEWLKTGVDSFNPEGTPIERIISQLLEDSLRRDVFQRVCFGESGNSSSNYDQIDGLWTRLIDSSGASNYCVLRASTQLGTAALSAGEAIAALKAVYEESNVLLKQMPNSKKKFFVTGSVFENLLSSYEAITAGTEAQFSLQLNGPTGALKYRGIDVVPIYEWDRQLTISTNPWSSTTKHLILYTTKENHMLGVQKSADLNKIEGRYIWEEDVFKVKGNMAFGYQYLHCDLQTIAY